MNTVNRQIFIYIFLICSLISIGQKKGFPFGAMVDYQALKHQSFSLGFGFMSYNKEKATKCGWLLSSEYLPKDNVLLKDTYGFKFGGNVSNKFLTIGYAFGYFTDFKDYRAAFTPEIGFGYKSIFLVYRRNLSLFNTGVDNLNKDNLSLRIYIPLDKRWLP
jgi:hypothetical protein